MIAITLTAALFLQAAAAIDFPDDKIVAQPASEQVVAVVNGKNITAGQVEKILWDWHAYEATQEIMGLVMVEDYATKQGVSASREEVSAYLEQIIGELRAQVPPGRTFEQELMAQGSSYSRLYLRAKVELLARKVVLKDLRPGEMRKISRILIVARTDGEADVEAARLRADEAVAMLKRGESWAEVVGAMSDDQQARQTGGEIGWVMPNDLPETVRTEVVKLQQGGFTEPIRSNGTFAIFRVEALGPPAEEEMRSVEQAHLNRGLQQLYERIRQESQVDNRVVPPITAPPPG